MATKISQWQPMAEENNIEVDDIKKLLDPSPNCEYEELKMPTNVPESDKHTLSQIVINMTNKAKSWMDEENQKYVPEDDEELK